MRNTKIERNDKKFSEYKIISLDCVSTRKSRKTNNTRQRSYKSAIKSMNSLSALANNEGR